jgi:amino acid adenylation domain-containing protein
VLRPLHWLTTDRLGEGLEEAWREPGVGGDALAFLQYTSGSTAAPKGVMLTHSNLLHNEELIRHAFRQSAESVIVGWLPLYHDMGLIGNVLQPLYLGARCVLMSPVSFLQQPLRWLRAVSNYRGTTSGGPNFAYDLCVRKIPEAQRAGLDLSSWSVAFNGAEPIRRETLESFAGAFAPHGFRREAFSPCYGLAEATLIVSGGSQSPAPVVRHVEAKALEAHRVVEAARGEDERALVGCGGALPDQRIAVVDWATLKECAPGAVGEIWVSGPSVAQGYWGHPEESERTFAARLADTGEGPFLRTGDLGFMHEGELFVTGRLKDLIIIRGRNHYPQDIELTAEQSHRALRPGCGAAFAVADGGEERLVVVQEVDHRQGLDAAEVCEAINRAVAEEHEIQAHAVVLVRAGTIPKTSSGKIQRNACREAYLGGELREVGGWRAGRAEPTSPAADSLPAPQRDAASIAEWLRRQLAAKVGVASETVELDRPVVSYGLDSLAAIELTHAVEGAFGVTLPPTLLLEGATLAELAAALLSEASRPAESVPEQSAPRGASSEHPLSRGQQALWFLQQMAPSSTAYNITNAVRVLSELDVEALRRAFDALVRRHAALRTTFVVRDGGPAQVIGEDAGASFHAEDASGWREEALRERLAAEAERPFDLGQGPLLRVCLFRRSTREHVLLLVIHHIVADFWSLSVLMHELGALYAAERGAQAVTLAPLAVQYTEHARREEEMLRGPEGERLWSYWQKRLGGELPELNLPAGRPRPPVQTFRGASEAFNLDEGLTERLKALGREHGATLYMTLLAAFQTLLHRYTGQEDVLTGTPTAGRGRAEFAGVVGYFVNPVVLRSDLSGDPTFTEFLARVRRTTLSAFEHQSYPFPLLVERLQPERDPSRSPLFQVMFVLQQAHALREEGISSFALREGGARLALDALILESMPVEQRIAQFDLTLTMAEVGGGLSASLEYNTALFDPATAQRMAGHFETLLRGLVAEPDARLSALPLLPPAERARLLVEWNDTAAGYPRDRCIHELFEAQAGKTPEAVALVSGDERLTYAELNGRANRLAHYLRRLGVGPEAQVGVLADRSAGMVVALLGVLKAGGAYVPLDPEYPADRLAFMLEDAAVKVLLTHERLKVALPEHSAAVVLLDGDSERVAAEDASNLPRAATPSNLAYVIYTSGSTGRPKGVAIEHRSTVTLIHWAREVFSPAQLAGVLASTSICFDLSVFEIFVTLAAGGKVILARNALQLPALGAAGEVTLVNTVPSAMAELVRGGGVPASVTTVNLAGEALPQALVQQIYAATQVSQVWNLYGPSEDTTYSTYALIPEGAQTTPPIGRPLSDTQVYLLDARLQPVPTGVPGELYVGGAGLARGYLNRAGLTAERFVPDPFSREPGARLYRTGDLARAGRGRGGAAGAAGRGRVRGRGARGRGRRQAAGGLRRGGRGGGG